MCTKELKDKNKRIRRYAHLRNRRYVQEIGGYVPKDYMGYKNKGLEDMYKSVKTYVIKGL